MALFEIAYNRERARQRRLQEQAMAGVREIIGAPGEAAPMMGPMPEGVPQDIPRPMITDTGTGYLGRKFGLQEAIARMAAIPGIQETAAPEMMEMMLRAEERKQAGQRGSFSQPRTVVGQGAHGLEKGKVYDVPYDTRQHQWLWNLAVPSFREPAFRGAEAAEKERAKLNTTRAFNMAGIGETLNQAERVLTGLETGETPTESIFGTFADWAGSIVGYTPRGAEEADIMKALGGALLAKMPRMEGPQSDRDVQVYREMAGQLGDPTIPRKRRIAALKKVREIWQRYEHLNPDLGGQIPSMRGPARPQTQADFNALPPGTEYIDPDDGQLYRK